MIGLGLFTLSVCLSMFTIEYFNLNDDCSLEEMTPEEMKIFNSVHDDLENYPDDIMSEEMPYEELKIFNS